MKQTEITLRHIWQEDPLMEDAVDLAMRQRCGLACLEMVLKHWGIRSEAHEILARAREHKSLNETNHWFHPGEVETLKSFGLTSWRRNWNVDAEDQTYFETKEDYSKMQMIAYRAQLKAEEGRLGREGRFLASLQHSLLADQPVIVSVKAEFSHNHSDHQIVIAGWDEGSETYYVYDPIRPSGPTKTHQSYLLAYARFLAIFAKPSLQ